MESYSVKQIADMLHTQPETVRRWIRSGKLHAKKTSRKEGHVITEEDFKKFLKNSPKYAGVATGILGMTTTILGATATLAGITGIGLSPSNIVKKDNKFYDESFSKENIKQYLKEEIERKSQAINQKLYTIEQIQKEIANEQQQIAEFNGILAQLEREK